jgi:hypothetical protein
LSLKLTQRHKDAKGLQSFYDKLLGGLDIISTQQRFAELLISFLPRPIKSEEDIEKTQAVVDNLLD